VNPPDNDCDLPVKTVPAFGTTATVSVTDPTALGDAEALLLCEIDDMDLAASRFRPDSEIMRLCMQAGSDVEVSPLLFEAIRTALWAAAWSDGAVDPTVGNLVVALGYDRDFKLIDRPNALQVAPLFATPARVFGHSPASLEAAPGSSGLRLLTGTREWPDRHVTGRSPRRMAKRDPWRSIELDESNRTVKVPKGILLDLGATAKALAADRAARSIAELTETGALVCIGGDVAMAGRTPRDGWSIGIAHESNTRATDVDQVVAVHSGGIASSGTLARTWRRPTDARKVVHHIVDPRTGENPSECWNLVSVAAPSCVIANAASTASVIWGRSAPNRLALAGLPARLVSAGGDVTTICGWPQDAGPMMPAGMAS
jgi:thiamine biosynthesis lipoprotein